MTKDDAITKLIPAIVEKIKDAYQPQKIILFGSHAHGTPDRDSDIDLLVVTDQPLSNEEAITVHHMLLRETHAPVQIVAVDSREFDETKNVIGGITYPAAKYGKLLYEKS